MKVNTKKIAKLPITMIVKSQQFFSITSIIFTVMAAASTIIIQLVADALLHNLLPLLLILIVLTGVVISNVMNIKKPHIITFIIECIGIFFFLANIAYGNYLIALHKDEANAVSLMIKHFLEIEQQGDFSVIVDAFKLAWQEIVLVGLLYTLRISIHFHTQKASLDDKPI